MERQQVTGCSGTFVPSDWTPRSPLGARRMPEVSGNPGRVRREDPVERCRVPATRKAADERRVPAILPRQQRKTRGVTAVRAARAAERTAERQQLRIRGRRGG